MKKILKGQKGYTLIELAIVIVIMGVMASILIPQARTYDHMLIQARSTKARVTLQNAYNYCQTSFATFPEYESCDPTNAGIVGTDVELTVLSNSRSNWVAIAKHKPAFLNDPLFLSYSEWVVSAGTINIPTTTKWMDLTQDQTDYLASLGYPPTPPEG